MWLGRRRAKRRLLAFRNDLIAPDLKAEVYGIQLMFFAVYASAKPPGVIAALNRPKRKPIATAAHGLHVAIALAGF